MRGRFIATRRKVRALGDVVRTGTMLFLPLRTALGRIPPDWVVE